MKAVEAVYIIKVLQFFIKMFCWKAKRPFIEKSKYMRKIHLYFYSLKNNSICFCFLPNSWIFLTQWQELVCPGFGFHLCHFPVMWFMPPRPRWLSLCLLPIVCTIEVLEYLLQGLVFRFKWLKPAHNCNPGYLWGWSRRITPVLESETTLEILIREYWRDFRNFMGGIWRDGLVIQSACCLSPGVEFTC